MLGFSAAMARTVTVDSFDRDTGVADVIGRGMVVIFR